MDIREVVVTNKWQKVADGSEDVVIHIRGLVEICEMPNKPDIDAYVIKIENQVVMITAPSIIWIRIPADSPENVIVFIS
ncbi:hypothetical protein WDI34_005191 [Salmonella enterica subsp. enterica]|nr:hypothetical protein [Salmonella enterica subsp. enterica]EFP1523264.1 hypothetical protein [Salmonella enterica]EJI0209984.1 hypothetical protein [Salmonella enterica subsp. enterica]